MWVYSVVGCLSSHVGSWVGFLALKNKHPPDFRMSMVFIMLTALGLPDGRYNDGLKRQDDLL